MPFDVVSFGETMLRFSPPHSGRLEEAKTLSVYVAGAESNTLACLARLGLNASWLSALPLNPLGQHVEAELRRHRVETSHVVWVEGGARLGTYYAEEAPNPLGTQVYYDRAQSACALVDPQLVNFSVIDTSKILYLTGITPALSERTREIYTRFLRSAHTQDVPLAFDVNYRSKLWTAERAVAGIEDACRQASLLFCTRGDAAALWGFAGSPEEVLRQMERRFGIAGRAKTIVLTLGSEGAAQLHNGVYGIEAAFHTEGTMRFGSGDAFAAGYLYAYLDGQFYHQMHEQYGSTALTFGNALAALKRCIAGDIAVVTLNEIQAVLQGQEGTMFR